MALGLALCSRIQKNSLPPRRMGKNAHSAVINHGTSQAAVKALEFYSGIGGMHFACERACKLGHIPSVEVLAAFDINPVANAIYEHNFGNIVRRNNIEALPVKQIDEYAAELWMLAPPCQPYTRQGLRKGINDARAQSFVALLAKIPEMSSPPSLILIENVLGFESSSTREALSEVLQEAGYHLQEFILSPTDFGTPYSRPRYFGLARMQPFSVQKTFGTPWTCRPLLILDALSRGHSELKCSPQESIERRCIRDFLEAMPSDAAHLATLTSDASGSAQITDDETQRIAQKSATLPPYTEQAQTSTVSVSGQPTGASPPPIASSSAACQSKHGDGLVEADHVGQAVDAEQDDDLWAPFRVPRNAVYKCCHCIDVVTADLHDANCFTKAYSKYAKGTGSVLATQNLHVLDSFPDWGHREEGSRPWYSSDEGRCNGSRAAGSSNAQHLAESMWALQLRYFSPREVANLHTFPENFSFPAEVTLRQRYACLGNSLSVEVVAALLQYLFHGLDY